MIAMMFQTRQMRARARPVADTGDLSDNGVCAWGPAGPEDEFASNPRLG